MPRKASKGKRIQFGVQKHKIRAIPVDHNRDSSNKPKNPRILGVPLDLISQVASKCFKLVCWLCFKFCLVPITTTKGSMDLEDDDNKLVPSAGFRRVCHYAVVTVLVFDQAFKFLMSMNQVMNQPFDDINTIVCLVIVGAVIFTCGVSVGTVMRPQEAIDLINGWSNVLGHLHDCTGEEYSTFGEPSNAVKMIATSLIPFFAVTMYTFGVNILPFLRLPFSYYVVYEDMISSDTVPSIWLKIIFTPLEIVTFLLPLTNLVLAAIVLETSVSVMRTQIEATRNIPVNNLADRRMVEHLHMCDEIFNRILNPWYKFITPQTFLGCGSLITVALFISIRHTEIPFLLYIFFPYLAIVLAAVLGSVCWDGIIVLRGSEDLVSSLRSMAPAYVVRLEPKQRAYAMKRAKSARPNFFQIGVFADFSLDSTIAVYDEILNQLLFLLSL